MNVPEWKLSKLCRYFGRKSPKAIKAREGMCYQPVTISIKQGVNSPLWGETSKPGTQRTASKGPCPVPEERGRGQGNGGRKSAAKVLEILPYDPGPGSKCPQQGQPIKRLRGVTPDKAKRSKDKVKSKQPTALQEWLVTAKEGLETLPGSRPQVRAREKEHKTKLTSEYEARVTQKSGRFESLGTWQDSRAPSMDLKVEA